MIDTTSGTVAGPRWTGHHERDLADYFGGLFAALAGLRSGFGGQLERARDGLGDVRGGLPSSEAPPIATSGHELDRMRRIERSLRLCGDGATAVLRARYSRPSAGQCDGLSRYGESAQVVALVYGRERAISIATGCAGKSEAATARRTALLRVRSEAETALAAAQRLYASAWESCRDARTVRERIAARLDETGAQ